VSARWWWLGFTDETRPKGERALGAAIVKANTGPGAGMIAEQEGIVPDGDHVQILHGEIPEEWGEPPPGFAGRLLDVGEAELLARRWNPSGAGLATSDDIRAAFLDDGAKPGEELFRRSRGKR